MTSISSTHGGTDSSVPWIFYLTVVGEQAQISLRQLLAVWELEGDPPDIGVWKRDSGVDEQQVWSHLQGALFAGITLARMFDPHLPNISSKASSGQRAQQEKKRVYAQGRAQKLRELLNVDENSALLQIRRVRDALEHFDERIDSLVLSGDVASVSDFHIALGGQFLDVPGPQPSENGEGLRHVTMRQFAPELGVLYFGSEFIDLFAFEAALHSLLASMPEAYESAAPDPSNILRYGGSRIARWQDGQISQRRSEIMALRKAVYEAGHWLLRPTQRPQTVLARWTEPVGPS
ncbi:hypothetical protein ABIB35_001700 [Arthrobacter sp. UYP6]